MNIPVALLGAIFITVVLWKAYETIVLPHRVTHWVRMTRLLYRRAWRLWKAAGSSQKENCTF